MNVFLNLYLLVFVVGIICFFINKNQKIASPKFSKILLVLGTLFFILYLTELFKIIDFSGVYSQNIFYGLSLSLFLLAMKSGIKNKAFRIFNFSAFVINIPIIHQFIYLFFFTLFGITLYETPNVIKNEKNYRIESNNSAPGMSMNENLYFIRKDFPFEKKSKIATIPRKIYLDSITFSQNKNKITIKSFGKEMKIDTIFNIKKL